MDELDSTYSDTGRPEDGISRQRNVSELKLAIDCLCSVVYNFLLIDGDIKMLHTTQDIKNYGLLAIGRKVYLRHY